MGIRDADDRTRAYWDWQRRVAAAGPGEAVELLQGDADLDDRLVEYLEDNRRKGFWLDIARAAGLAALFFVVLTIATAAGLVLAWYTSAPGVR